MINRSNLNFIAIDGDDVGLKLRNFIVANDIDGAKKYSEEICKFFNDLSTKISDSGCRIVFCGGDSILAFAEQKLLFEIVDEMDPSHHSFSVGIGETAEMAYLALQLAKARGKAQAVAIKFADAETIRIW